jgi:uroporphyrinogen decarboxylase
MNSLERVQAAVRLEPVDRVPVMPQVFGHAARLCGVSLGTYVRDGATLARCQLQALGRYGYDAVFAVMDVGVESEAMGSVLRYREHLYPVVEHHVLTASSEPDSVQIPDPQEAGRMPQMLRALETLASEVGERVLVVGCVVGPMTLTTQLLGMSEALYLAIDDPARFERVLDLATNTIIRFGLAQLEAGAHLPVVFDPSASPAVVPGQFFREFEAPRLNRVFRALTEAGSVANWLHIAGPTESILPDYVALGVNIANFDYCVGAEEAVNALPETCLDGNLRPLAFVDASPSDVAAGAAALIHTFAERGGFILSSGCEIPPEARPENVEAMVNAVVGACRS